MPLAWQICLFAGILPTLFEANLESKPLIIQPGVQMSKVDKTMHVGICHSSDTDESAGLENIKKARHTMYSLMSAGLHGEN